MSTVAVVLCAHGSRAPGVMQAQDRICEELAAALGLPVRPAFLEINEPDIPTAIDSAVGEGASRVLLVAYFLHEGNHTTRDIPAILAAAGRRHPDVSLSMTPPLGPDPRLVAICADRARQTLAAAGGQPPSGARGSSATTAAPVPVRRRQAPPGG